MALNHFKAVIKKMAEKVTFPKDFYSEHLFIGTLEGLESTESLVDQTELGFFFGESR